MSAFRTEPPICNKPLREYNFGKICLKVYSFDSKVANNIYICLSSEMEVNYCLCSLISSKSPLIMESTSSYGVMVTSIAICQMLLDEITSLPLEI